jgi:hypothetical protein
MRGHEVIAEESALRVCGGQHVEAQALTETEFEVVEIPIDVGRGQPGLQQCQAQMRGRHLGEMVDAVGKLGDVAVSPVIHGVCGDRGMGRRSCRVEHRQTTGRAL